VTAVLDGILLCEEQQERVVVSSMTTPTATAAFDRRPCRNTITSPRRTVHHDTLNTLRVRARVVRSRRERTLNELVTNKQTIDRMNEQRNDGTNANELVRVTRRASRVTRRTAEMMSSSFVRSSFVRSSFVVRRSSLFVRRCSFVRSFVRLFVSVSWRTSWLWMTVRVSE